MGQFHDLAVRDRPWPDRGDLTGLGAGGIDVWIAGVAEWADRSPTASLAGAELARGSAFAREADRVRFTTGRVLLRRLLAGYLGTVPKDLVIEPGRYGKPVLSGRWATSRLAFNVSKSGDHVAFAFAVDREIGVDIETLQPPRLEAGEPEALAGFFTAAEAALVRSRSPADARATFYRFWVCKEACLKCRGTGLATPLDEIAIDFSADGRARGRCQGEEFAIQSLDDRDESVAAVAVRGTAMPEPRVIRLMPE